LGASAIVLRDDENPICSVDLTGIDDRAGHLSTSRSHASLIAQTLTQYDGEPPKVRRVQFESALLAIRGNSYRSNDPGTR
jgi:hypothetical protein